MDGKHAQRDRKQAWIKAIDIYGLSEVVGPGVSCECEYQDGLHINEDHFVPEIIDPESLQPLPPGSRGELVFYHRHKRRIASDPLPYTRPDNAEL
jgi:phenylacetate-coenzyme A ligase PaaK-like adenylate-forming protein